MTIVLISISYSIEYIGIILVTAIALGILLFLLLFSFVFVHFKDSSILFAEKVKIVFPFKLKYIQSGFYIMIGFLPVFFRSEDFLMIL